MRRFLIAAILISQGLAGGAEISRDWRAALDRITPNALEGHVSFLASDALKGRDTPSPGLEVAAEYIAARFRAAGLEPGGDAGYFQTANWSWRTQAAGSLQLAVHAGDQIIRVAGRQLAGNLSRAVKVTDAAVTRADLDKAADLDAAEIDGKTLVVAVPDLSEADRGRRRRAFMDYRRLTRMLKKRTPALVLYVDPSAAFAGRLGRPRLIDPENDASGDGPVMAVTDGEVARVFEGIEDGPSAVRLSALGEPAADKPVKLRNVVAILRGSDPALDQTAVMLSAHYDHIGVKDCGKGDLIYNGANDDASGTASVVGAAEALAGLREKPRRSIVFVTFFGEEKGMLGAGYYVRHPVFPLGDTVAAVNLEQVGRTDSSEGPQIRNASVTGFDYSEVSRILQAAGKRTGIEVYEDVRNNDRFFRASDNIRLAERGVPAHSVTTAYVYPDYHGVGDHWEKIDYENMAAVTRMVALGVLMMAESSDAPRWNREKSQADRYREIREQGSGEGAGIK